jgi:tight adherence protein C
MKRITLLMLIVVLPVCVLTGLGAAALTGDPVQGALTTLIGMTVATFVAGLFGQPGSAKLSPQRAAAIATGHSDRETVFEQPVTKPLMGVLLGISHSLSLGGLKNWIHRNLVAAGSPNYYTAEEYLAVCMAGGLATAGVLEVFHLLVLQQFSVVLLLVAFAGGTLAGLYKLYDKAQKRLMVIRRRVPYALDLIALAMGAGANFTEAVQTITSESGEDPLNVEFKTMLAEMELGATRRRALQNLAQRVPLESLRSITASVMQAEELGTPLGDVLRDQAQLLRLQRSVRAENKAAVASVRILIPCLLLVMAVILAVFGPAILRAATKGLF